MLILPWLNIPWRTQSHSSSHRLLQGVNRHQQGIRVVCHCMKIEAAGLLQDSQDIYLGMVLLTHTTWLERLEHTTWCLMTARERLYTTPMDIPTWIHVFNKWMLIQTLLPGGIVCLCLILENDTNARTDHMDIRLQYSSKRLRMGSPRSRMFSPL